MSNMKKKTKAFTLAEALILLLIAALIAAALVPVITRKHRDVAEHGKWICTLNSQGQHVIKTIYRGKTSDFIVAANDECIFTPPANAKNFTLKAVGGGGGGAGGTAGSMESVYDSRTDGAAGTFAGNVDYDGHYQIIAVGSGGAGGGMGCGEAKDQKTAEAGFDLRDAQYFISESNDHHGLGSVISANTVNSDWYEDWSWDMSSYPYHYEAQNQNPTNCEVSGDYTVDCENLGDARKTEDPNYDTVYENGYFDLPVDGFRYDLLYQNDARFTDKNEHGKDESVKNQEIQLTDEKGQWINDYETYYEFKFHYLDPVNSEGTYRKKAICFAEPNWPMSKEITEQDYQGLYLGDMDSEKPNVKCWNLPGEGGFTGSTATASEFLKGGQSIYATVGTAGKGQKLTTSHTVGLYVPDTTFSKLIMKTASVEDGDVGGSGNETTVNYGTTDVLRAAGGNGGAARQLVDAVYKNIPVMECSVEQLSRAYADDYSCCGKTTFSCRKSNSTSCTGEGCSQSGPYKDCLEYYPTYECTDSEGNKSTCGGGCKEYSDPYWICSTGSHSGGYFKKGGCVQRVRPTYFDRTLDINFCAYTAEIAENHPARNGSATILQFMTSENYWTGLDYPRFVGEVKPYVPGTDSDGEDYDIAAMFGRQRYQGEPGSGGYGAGEQVKSYILTDDNQNSYGKLYGEDGEDGYVQIIKSSAYGGTGGEAGQYVSTMMKKIGRLKIKVGKPGAPGAGGEDGKNGFPTRIYQEQDADVMFELQGGKGGQANKMVNAKDKNTVAGGNGDPSPVENESNRAKIIAYGGKTDSNPDWTGQSATIFNTWDPKQVAYEMFNGNFTYVITGGHPLDLTYGAGGGGGAGGTASNAGYGGAGTPGVVIIEW